MIYRRILLIASLGALLVACGVEEALPDLPQAFTAELSGQNDVFEVDTEASGNVAALLVDDVLTFTGAYADLENELMAVDGAPGHVYELDNGSLGERICPIEVVSSEGLAGLIGGVCELSDEEIEMLEDENLFVVIHTDAHEDGEIGGPLLRALDDE